LFGSIFFVLLAANKYWYR